MKITYQLRHWYNREYYLPAVALVDSDANEMFNVIAEEDFFLLTRRSLDPVFLNPSKHSGFFNIFRVILGAEIALGNYTHCIT